MSTETDPPTRETLVPIRQTTRYDHLTAMRVAVVAQTYKQARAIVVADNALTNTVLNRQPHRERPVVWALAYVPYAYPDQEN